ncbi:hypothetical protein ASPZODRAFT_20608 [Penicilliopsis zonata CBS 506.65]|uniref:Haloacid dehalogenase, type II n=1 Tax=Penicilliopsis zonata CBS 506.65 TaxID=1073090 RepID=A0A1L9S551_9EURO|nr:hypothetical protein ASPZODRAFT_20608 [Penicilliopsis zonata CBS 506.65]OJJ42282.1 hypothetical protein ASPZODRAFT_20608 [Penicilliopsis zonata CBS 506.65]
MALLVEIKNVLITSSKDVATPKNTWCSMLCSDATAEYQCGWLSQVEYYDRLADGFGVASEAVKTAFETVHRTLAVDEAVVAAIVQAKARDGQLRVLAVANLSSDEVAMVRALPLDCGMFEDVFISSELGMRKPELRFYRHVPDAVGRTPHELILLDR